MIGAYCGRWNLETTFQEMRSLSRPGDDPGLTVYPVTFPCNSRYLNGVGFLLMYVLNFMSIS